MSKFPSLPLFTDAYIADTKHLTTEEHGAYLQLLMYAWRSKGCRLQNDDKFLAKTLGISLAKWLKLKPSVMDFWTLVGGFWTQKRLAKEHAFVADRTKKRRAAGALGGRPKSLKNNDTDKAKGSQEKSKPKAPTPTPTDSPKAPKGAEPEGFAEFWDAYPRRRGDNPRKTALAAYSAALRRGATHPKIMAGLRRYVAELTEDGKIGSTYVAQAATWLNQDRFERPADHAAPPVAAVPPAPVPDETWRERVREWKVRCGYWPWRQSPPPDHPRTLVPPHILAEFGLGPEACPAEPPRKTGTDR